MSDVEPGVYRCLNHVRNLARVGAECVPLGIAVHQVSGQHIVIYESDGRLYADTLAAWERNFERLPDPPMPEKVITVPEGSGA